MTAIRSTSRHPSAGELVRRLDRELDPRAEARLARHLERCASCRARLEELTEHSNDAAQWLRGITFADPGNLLRREAARDAVRAAALRRRSIVRVRRGWAAAAAVAALLVVSFSVDPLRAWMMQRLAITQPGAAGASVASLPSAVVGGEGSVISFHPASGTFELSVERAQTVGEVLLQVRAVSQATAQVTNGATETMLVLPSGLRIENSAASRASYRVTLPASVREVTVRVGDGPPHDIVISTAEWVERIPLAR
jgi:hypothetical protein